MSTETKKLDPKTAWLFAGAAVVAGIAASFGLKTQNWKVVDAVYTVLFGGLAFASTFLTQAKTASVVGRFAAASAVFAVFLIWFVKSGLESGNIGLIPSGGPFDSILKIFAKAGATPFAIFVAAFEFLVCVLTSLVGAIIGSRIAAGKGYGLIPARKA